MKFRGLIAGLTSVGALFGMLMAVPLPADGATGSERATMSTNSGKAVPRKMTNYGSGVWGGPAAAVTRSGDPATADWLMLGDSIGNRCTSDIRAALAAKGLTLATITQSGQNAEGLVDLLLNEPVVPERVLLEAGTNNVFEPPMIAPQIARVQNWAADNAIKIKWADTYVGRPTTALADARNSGWVNSYIYSAVPFQDIIKWQAALGAAVGRGKSLSLYLEDGVHPWADAGTGHADGCAFYAAVVAGGIGA